MHVKCSVLSFQYSLCLFSTCRTRNEQGGLPPLGETAERVEGSCCFEMECVEGGAELVLAPPCSTRGECGSEPSCNGVHSEWTETAWACW